MEVAETPHASFACKSCGAALQYAPGTTTLVCEHCGAANQIAASTELVHEEDYVAVLQNLREQADTVDVLTVHCGSCGAETSLPPDVTADRCPFCGTPVVAVKSSRKLIRPECLLPFGISRDQAVGLFSRWIGQLWFAPTSLRREAAGVRLLGIYIPAWTYDSRTTSDYTGQRGDDYWETESYWDTETYTETENGQTVTRTRQVLKTRQVRKTRWSSAAGRVGNAFDDVFVLATRSLPPDLAGKLGTWDLQRLIPFQEEYLSGFVAESYQVDLEQGFATARELMQPTIQQTVCRDIGGDHQRISTLSTSYDHVTFKHLLLPLWLCAYRYRGQLYRFLVNARTGEVHGQRPYSYAKIVLLAGLILAVILVVVLMSLAARQV